LEDLVVSQSLEVLAVSQDLEDLLVRQDLWVLYNKKIFQFLMLNKPEA
jgi:hypothetical protein